MTVHALKTSFTDRQGYQEWRKTWKTTYAIVSERIRRRKLLVKELQRAGDPDLAKHQRELRMMGHDARKLMTLLGDAKERRDRFLGIRKQLDDQKARCPIVITAPVVDFHFNKFALEVKDFPKWVCKAKGQTFYIRHMESSVPFSTRELEEGSTLGMLRFRNVTLIVDENFTATLSPKESLKQAA